MVEIVGVVGGVVAVGVVPLDGVELSDAQPVTNKLTAKASAFTHLKDC